MKKWLAINRHIGLILPRMKRPKANDKVQIKANGNIVTEACLDGFPDPSQGARGWKFAVISTQAYRTNEVYFLVGDNGEERRISVSSIAVPYIQANEKLVVFSASMPDSR